MEIDLKKVSILKFEGIDHSDYPDYCDAYPVEAEYDGKEMSDEMLEALQDEYPEFVNEQLFNYLH